MSQLCWYKGAFFMEEIKSRKNPIIVHLKKLGTDSSYRRETDEMLCDGEKLLQEALNNGAELTAVLTDGIKPLDLPPFVPVYKVEHDIIETVSPLKSPQSVLFSCRIPTPGKSRSGSSSRVILEEIQDPGNVGTILRTAAAFGIGSVIMTGSCADPYHPKTIRASMGAVFRQCIELMELEEIAALKAQGIRLCGAALTEDSCDIRSITCENTAFAIGSEGRGLSEELLALCDEKIIIPMSPGSESLNAAVAAAIIMWEASKGSV